MSCWFWGERDRGMFWRDSPENLSVMGLCYPHIFWTCWCLQREDTVGASPWSSHYAFAGQTQRGAKFGAMCPCAHRPDNECVSSLSCNQTLMKSLHAGGALISHCSRTPRGSASTCFNTASLPVAFLSHVWLTWTPSFVSTHETYCVLLYIFI